MRRVDRPIAGPHIGQGKRRPSTNRCALWGILLASPGDSHEATPEPCLRVGRRERAALEWIEALTNITDGHVSDAVYDLARRHFGEKELVDLALVPVAINGWNRLAIAFRSEAGKYQPQKRGENPQE